MKNIQISEELFFALLKYHLVEIDDVLPEIKKGLEDKLEAMVRRDLYTKYKTAPTEEEREKARQEYLDKVGMHRDFRCFPYQTSLINASAILHNHPLMPDTKQCPSAPDNPTNQAPCLHGSQAVP